MSGFLTNLVVRSFGLTEMIRPRSPSLFEPQSGTARLVTSPIYSEEGFGEAPVSAEPAWEAGARRFSEIPVSQGTKPLLSTRKTAADEANSMRESGLPGRMTGDYPPLSPMGFKPRPLDAEPKDASYAIRPEHATSAPATLPFVQRQATRAPFNEDVLTSRPEPGPLAKQPTIARPERSAARSESGALANQSAAAPRSTVLASDLGPVGSSRQSRISELLRPPPSLVLPAPVPIQPAKLNMSSQAAPYRDRKRPDTGWQKAEPETIIQVTIGRVEVRAEQVSARPPTNERSAPQPMSLDEYLRRRAGRSGE